MGQERSPKGVGGTLRQVLGSLTEGVRYRGELFALEFGEERNAFLTLLILSMAALFLVFLSFLSLNILLLVLFWDSRVVLAAVLTGLYLMAAAGLGLVIRNRIRNTPRPFNTTLEVLRKDQEAITRDRDHHGE